MYRALSLSHKRDPFPQMLVLNSFCPKYSLHNFPVPTWPSSWNIYAGRRPSSFGRRLKAFSIISWKYHLLTANKSIRNQGMQLTQNEAKYFLLGMQVSRQQTMNKNITKVAYQCNQHGSMHTVSMNDKVIECHSLLSHLCVNVHAWQTSNMYSLFVNKHQSLQLIISDSYGHVRICYYKPCNN